jgi:iron uptake system component EfeO
MTPHRLTLIGLALLSAAGCSSGKTDDEYRQDVVNGMRSGLIADLANLVAASQTLQAAAPTPADRGWDATADATAIASMKTAWIDCRTAYEHIEGATAPIFPDIDASIDSRYEDFLEALPTGDSYLFDGMGVTGMHAVERILYADVTPARVVQYESMLQGYVAAAFPATAQEAADFKSALVAKQIADAQNLHDSWESAHNYDLDAAFSGLISLMNEQREKVDKASTNQEESRYSQMTMADIRNNLAGTQKVYALFQPWIRSKNGGPAIDASILQGFQQLQVLYATIPGDAIPQPPATWSSENPTADDLQTPFGMLYAGVEAAVDPNEPDSIVAHMNQSAVLLGFKEFVE